MLKLIGFFVRLTVFSVIVLVLGNWMTWRGRTISDQIRTRLSHPESVEMVDRVTDQVKGWAGTLARSSERPSRSRRISTLASDRSGAGASDKQSDDEIRPSERQKLKALIRELNSSRDED